MNARDIVGMGLSRRSFVRSVAGSAVAGMAPRAWAAETSRNTLIVVSEQQPTSLDPISGNNGGDYRYLYPVYDPLIDWDPDTLQPIPRLVNDWQFSAPTTLVLNLRANVTFHDDTPFDAEAVKFNFDRIRSEPKSNFKNDLSSVTSIEVTGPLQITLHLARPNAALPAVLSERAGLIVSPTAARKLGGDLSRNPVGTGPWIFEAWKDGEIVTYRRNPHYWQPGIPKLDGLSCRIFTDVSAGLRSVLAGESDIVNFVATSQKPVVDRSNRVKSDITTSQAFYPIWINSARPPFTDVRVRRALVHAINRTAYARVTASGLAEPAYGMFPKKHWAHDPELEKIYPYNPDMAKSLLAEAGFAKGFEMTLVGPNDDRSRQRQEFVTEQLSQVGIKVSIRGLSVNDAIKGFFVDKSADALLVIFGGRPDPSVTLRDLFGKSAFLNPSKTEPDGLNDALTASESTEDPSLRKEALMKAQRLVAENALMVPLAFDPQFTVMSTKVNGFRPNLFGRIRFDTMSL